MEKCNKIVIFDWGGVIENNNQSYYNISKAYKRQDFPA